MAMIGKVRRMKFRLKKSVREIAKATSLSRNTVRKYLRVEEGKRPAWALWKRTYCMSTIADRARRRMVCT
jgi:predicted transcriptional regulator